MFACIHCNKKFRYDSERKRHEQSHSPQFHCKICLKKFSFASAVRRHEKQHKRIEKVHCSLCERTFRDEALLKRHMKYAHKGSFSCAKCNAAFSCEAALQTHSKVHLTESERKFRCSFQNCGKSFNFSHHLKHHEFTHSNSKQHYCNLCGKGFIQLHHLKTHLKTHNPDKWLPCTKQDCEKKFVNEYARKRHIATHNKKLNKKKLLEYNDAEESSTSKRDTVSVTCEESVIKREQTSNTLENYVNQTNMYDIIKHQDNNASVNYNNIENVPDLGLPKSQSKLVISPNRVHENNCLTQLELSIKNTTNVTFTDCKTVLGGCLVSGSNEINENCLCAQININKNNKKTVVENKNISELPLLNNILKDNNNSINNEGKNNCNDCECANKTNQNDNRLNNRRWIKKAIDGLPELEHRIDGVIKIKETFDVDIKIEIKEEKIINKDLKHLVLNSCKAALGNCIASEDCLCAKMMIDEEQMNAQEIAEITPLDFAY